MNRVIARTETGRAFIVDVGGGRGRVLDLDQHSLSPEISIQAILARGAWLPFDGDEADVLPLLDHVEHVQAFPEPLASR